MNQAAYVKVGFLTAIAKGDTTSPLVSPKDAVELLGTVMGGYNVQSLIDLLQSPDPGLSPVPLTTTHSDIPLHATVMLEI